MSVTTTSNWQVLVSQEIPGPNDVYEEARPYVKETGGSNPIDVRILVATDPQHTASDAPTGSLSNGDGWAKLAEISDLSAGGDWPDISGAGYEISHHLVVVQVKDGSSGSGEARGEFLAIDREG